jgi:nitronate monooxygenase
VLAAQAMGADFAYIGSAFIATDEGASPGHYKQMIVASTSDDIVYSNLFTGVLGNYLRGSIVAAGPRSRQPASERPEQDELRRRRRAWKDVWGSGPGHRRDQRGRAGRGARRAPGEEYAAARALADANAAARRASRIDRSPARRADPAILRCQVTDLATAFRRATLELPTPLAFVRPAGI